LRRFHGRVVRVLAGALIHPRARLPHRRDSAACVRLARSPDSRSPDNSLLHADRAASTTLTTPRSDARATQLHYGPPTNNEEMVASLTRHGSIWSPEVIAAFSQVDRGKLRALGSAQSVQRHARTAASVAGRCHAKPSAHLESLAHSRAQDTS